MSARKKEDKHEKMVKRVEKDVQTIKHYIYDRSNGPTKSNISNIRSRIEKLADILDKYVGAIKADKKSIHARSSASIEKIASSVKTFYKSLSNMCSDSEKHRDQIHSHISDYLKDVRDTTRKQFQQVSTHPFLTWLIGRMTIHRMPVVGLLQQENLIGLANGLHLDKNLKPLIEYQPEKYTQDIADAIYDMVNRFAQEEEKNPHLSPVVIGYMNVLTEDDYIAANWIAERVRDFYQKKKKLDYKSIYEWETALRDALTILLANIVLLSIGSKFECHNTPQSIRERLDECFTALRMIIARRRVQQLEQRILMVGEQASLKDTQEAPDFSKEELAQLATRRKRKSRKPPKPKAVPRHASSSTLQSKATSTAASTQQQETTKPAARQQHVSFRQWLQQAPVVQSKVVPNPRFPLLLQRKQSNMPLLKGQVETLARGILEKAVDARAKSIVLVDVRNLGTKRHPDKGFQQKFTQLLRQADALLRQQVSIDDATQSICKPFFVFVDQGVLKDGLTVDDVGKYAVRIKVPCVKGAGVDCYYALQQQQDQQQRKNPMDDYVLLSLYSILMSYYKQYVGALGGDIQQQMDEMRQFIRRNPGVARYSADVVRQFRERVAQIHQLQRKIARDAIKPYLLSGDLFRDWILQKNETPQQQPQS